MSAIHKLLGTGISVALIVGASAGCGYRTAHDVSFDIERNDKISFTALMADESLPEAVPLSAERPRWLDYADEVSEPEPGPAPEPEYDPEPEFEPEPDYDTVSLITPSFKRQILQKQQTNGDSLGWLYVPGTHINNVILKNPSDKDNSYYLNVDFYERPNKNGVFCADYRAVLTGGREDMNRVTAIYGHSWDDNPDGGLFAQLKKFRSAEFAREHPYLFFSTENDNMAWEVFAVFDTTVRLPYIRPNLSTERFYDMIEMVNGLTLYNYDSVVNHDDKILTLSTCTYSVSGYPSLPEYNDYRFVIMAKLVEPTAPLKEQAVFAVNSNPYPPDVTNGFWD